MANEIGGRNDKLGNRYERNCIIFSILDVLEEKTLNCRFEGLGDEEIATDIYVVGKDEKNEYIQCKQRNGSNDNWRFSDIKKYDLLKKWKFHLDRNKKNVVVLQSPITFNSLSDLIRKAQNNDGDSLSFYKNQIQKSKSTLNDFKKYCKELNLNPDDDNDINIAMDYLCRTKIAAIPDETLKEMILTRIKFLLIGDENVLYNYFLDLVCNEEILGKPIDNSFLNEFFKRKNIVRRDLSNDDINFPCIERLNNDFKKSINLIDNRYIQRKELKSVVECIENCKSMIIHGKAGYGKSGLIHGLIEYLEQQKILYLALKLDKKTPEKNTLHWSKSLGFSNYFSYCLDQFSKAKKCVLILDQLDALRWTQIHSRNAIDICSNLIDEIEKLNMERKYKISIILVSRTFDIENDIEISKLINSYNDQDNTWIKLEVNLLEEENLKEIIGKDYNNYNSKLKKLLRIPSNLFIWEKISHNQNFDSINNTGDLISQWWKEIEKNGALLDFSSGSLSNARDEIVEKMNLICKNSVPVDFLSIDSTIIEFLCSKDFIIENDNKIFFSHQSLLDYYLVKNMIKKYFDGVSIIDLIGDKNQQYPNKRYQLQMFLEMMFDIDENKYIEATDIIIKSDKIRSYLKYVAFEVLGLVPNISSKIEKYVLENYDKENLFSNYFEVIFKNHEKMIAILIKNNIFDKWILDKEKQLYVIDLLRSINHNFTKIEVDFIEKNLFINESLDRELYKCFPIEMYYDTDELFELRLKMYERYKELLLNIFLNLNELIKFNEMRAIKIVEFLGKNLDIKKQHIKYSEQCFIEYTDDNAILESEKVINVLLPLVPKIKQYNYNIYEWEKHNDYEPSIQRIIISLLKASILNLTQKNYKKFWNIFLPFFNKGYIIHNELILYGLLNMPESEAKKIIEYLFSNIDNNCFEYTSGSVQSISLLKQIIVKFLAFLNIDSITNMEDKILNYKPSDMINKYKYYMQIKKENFVAASYLSYWGDFQYEILNVINNKYLSKRSIDLKKVLSRKFNFKTSHKFDNLRTKSFNVVAPISNKELSNNSWLKILTNPKICKINKSKYNDKTSTCIQSSLYEFQSSLSTQIQNDPSRFIKLFINNSEIILKEYIPTLFSAVAYSNSINTISNDIIENMFNKFDYKIDKYKIASLFCEIIARKEDTHWNKDIIELLKNIYNDIENGNIENDYITYDVKDHIDAAEEIEMKVINSAIGKFSKAVGNILWNNANLLDEFKEIANKMINSDDNIFKYSSLYILNPALKYDFSWASDRILSLFDYDCVYGFRNNRNIIHYIYKKEPKYNDKIIDIINYGIKLNSNHIQTLFSYIIVDFNILYNQFNELINNPPGSKLVKSEMLNMFIEYLDDENLRTKAKQAIKKFISFKDINFNAYRLFNSDKLDLIEDIEYILELFDCPISSKLIEPFIHYLKKSGTNLIIYGEIIFKIIDKAIKNYDKNNPDHNYAYDDLNYIIVRIFDEVYETNKEDLKIKCLDAWDEMFSKHIGSIRKLSHEIINI